MIPFPESSALYVRNLAEELIREKVIVVKPKKLIKSPFLFPLLRNALGNKVKLLHMHWIEGFAGLSAKNILWSTIKFIIFAI